jgi:uncharacterized protein
MIGARDIEAVVDQIAERFKPERIILFGSYARGTPTATSDVDFMVIRRHRGSSIDAAWRILATLDVPFGVDVLVRSPADIRRRLQWGDVFITDVIEHGIVLHDSTNRRMGEQGRRRLRHDRGSATVAKTHPV